MSSRVDLLGGIDYAKFKQALDPVITLDLGTNTNPEYWKQLFAVPLVPRSITVAAVDTPLIAIIAAGTTLRITRIKIENLDDATPTVVSIYNMVGGALANRVLIKRVASQDYYENETELSLTFNPTLGQLPYVQATSYAGLMVDWDGYIR